jgi:hypothetical protein
MVYYVIYFTMVLITAIWFLWEHNIENEIVEEDYGIALLLGLIWFIILPLAILTVVLKRVWGFIKIFLDKSENL